VLLVLEGSEEPELVLYHGTAELHGHVIELVSMVRQAVVLVRCRIPPGQTLIHVVEVRIALERIAALPRDNVEHRPRDVAVAGWRAERENLDFFDRVGVWPRPRGTGQRRREVRAVDQIQVFIGRGPERLGTRASRRGG